MPDHFFESKKRKRPSGSARPSHKAGEGKKRRGKAAASSSDEMGNSDLDAPQQQDEDPLPSDDEDPNETAAQKRLRLAQMYVDSVRKESGLEDGFDAADLERDIVHQRLQQDVLLNADKFKLTIANSLDTTPAILNHTWKGAHRLPLTCAKASPDCSQLFTCSKDGSIARWSLAHFFENNAISKLDYKPKIPSQHAHKKGKGKQANYVVSDETEGHNDELYTIDVSADRLISGGKDRKLGIWDISSPDRMSWVRGLKGHKDSIIGLAFRKGSAQFFSASYDRTVKLFDAIALSYIETLFGHQDKIAAVDALKGENALTAGSRDKTVRYWKIKEESQLVFRAGVTSKIRKVLEGGLDALDDHDEHTETTTKYIEGSTDCVAMIDSQHFLSGGDSGTICLWHTGKKKPIYTQSLAHGLNETVSETEGIIGTPRWITSLACLPYGDLFATGSWDGQIRLWQISPTLKSFSLLSTIPAIGIVNSLQILLAPDQISQAPKVTKALNQKEEKNVLIVAALAQEQKFGRWIKIKQAKNTALVALLKPKA